MVERKACDDSFDRSEEALRKAIDRLRLAGRVCIREAGSDLARACRTLGDLQINGFGKVLTENLVAGDLIGVSVTCRAFYHARRAGLNFANPTREDYVALSADCLADACDGVVRDREVVDLLSVGPSTVRSRAASGKAVT